MQKRIKCTEFMQEGIGSEGYVVDLDNKVKMGSKPIVSLPKQPTNCPHQGRFNPQVLRGLNCISKQ